ncbi:hypothetical protein A2819_02140 [Candidatus Azambacteria bacterium RIFCSPHIGHO2_01_FULL_40_24]|uniref:Nuclease associated modular domain-containing protein n=1 Tax=Candidatus Azambacteria bacterium RIFCSPHIGHO2_01_FULL_40_24 TaxID=1797301 RepID=A0A1F5B5B7_9BACT|nr:MAG: hypothetical protein A2819_02140 [Candidatus Azambacteria bacterium RIFCSPHIGHO2_01_FULL_40_24]
MSQDFYNDTEYKERQSVIMKENWRKGLFDSIRKREKRTCKGCGKIFEVIPSDPKIYCGHKCSAIVANFGRIQSADTKLKIGKALLGTKSLYKGIVKTPRVEVVCGNPKCKRVFIAEKFRNRKYCSNQCTMAVVGGNPTSPKASRGKAGIRKDISDKIYFYSRWEANYARLQNYLGIKWEYELKTFDLGSQNYTPDFYLPRTNTYIEVKNFLWKYSKIRDQKFRKLYPNIKLHLLLKDDYLKLENKYSKLIPNWEFKNSPFNVN